MLKWKENPLMYSNQLGSSFRNAKMERKSTNVFVFNFNEFSGISGIFKNLRNFKFCVKNESFVLRTNVFC